MLDQYPQKNYDPVCTKKNLKSDFHITGQLMENHSEYSQGEGMFQFCGFKYMMYVGYTLCITLKALHYLFRIYTNQQNKQYSS